MATPSKNKAPAANRLQLRRTYKADPARVFRAWSTAEDLRRWHAPGPFTVSWAELDLRVGGGYRIDMKEPDGTIHTVTGVYRVVNPPRQLVYTWKWEGDPSETVVTLDFLPSGTGTELVLTHEGFASKESRASHEGGWTSIMEKLDANL